LNNWFQAQTQPGHDTSIPPKFTVQKFPFSAFSSYLQTFANNKHLPSPGGMPNPPLFFMLAKLFIFCYDEILAGQNVNKY
jgi:hypothetical protein